MYSFFLPAVSRSSCVVDGQVYKDGVVFKPDCGICECLDGKIECINDFCGMSGKSFVHTICSVNNWYNCYNVIVGDKLCDMMHIYFFTHTGNLTDEQLDILRNDIYQLFVFQFQFSYHILIDLRYVRRNPLSKYMFISSACCLL